MALLYTHVLLYMALLACGVLLSAAIAPATPPCPGGTTLVDSFAVNGSGFAVCEVCVPLLQTPLVQSALQPFLACSLQQSEAQQFDMSLMSQVLAKENFELAEVEHGRCMRPLRRPSFPVVAITVVRVGWKANSGNAWRNVCQLRQLLGQSEPAHQVLQPLCHRQRRIHPRERLHRRRWCWRSRGAPTWASSSLENEHFASAPTALAAVPWTPELVAV